MYCDNCGKKLNGDENFCVNCGRKVEYQNMCENSFRGNNHEVQHKDNKVVISKISFVIFALIIFLNVAFFSWLEFKSLTADTWDNGGAEGYVYMGGLFFFFIPMLVLSFILSIISISNYFDDKRKRLKISKTRIIYTILNIIQVILIVMIFVFFVYLIISA